jgi:hypothetical protein
METIAPLGTGNELGSFGFEHLPDCAQIAADGDAPPRRRCNIEQSAVLLVQVLNRSRGREEASSH